MKTRTTNTLRPRRLFAVMLVLLLSACSAPKPGPARWTNVEGQTGCLVFGGWDRYTWTGACEDGYAAGYGELRGYGRGSETLSYAGQLRRGVRDGSGSLTVHVAGIGPLKHAGTFRNGDLISGTETQSNGYTKVYENGVEVRNYMAARGSDSSSGLSTFAAVLGGVAQGVAASRGAATPAYQPPPRTYTPSPVPSVAQSPHTASTATARATPTPAPAPSVGRDTPSGDEAVRNQCATIERYQGVWKAMNRCQEVVFVAFCHVNPDPDSWGRSLNCGNDQYGLAGPINPGHNETISSPGSRANVNYQSRSFACATARGKMFTAKLSNQGMSGQCR